MSKTYVKPNMAKYGTCQTLIQGSCGWGVENVTLDKTGYRKKNWRVKVYPPCPGPDPNGNVNCKAVCTKQEQCRKKNEC